MTASSRLPSTNRPRNTQVLITRVFRPNNNVRILFLSTVNTMLDHGLVRSALRSARLSDNAVTVDTEAAHKKMAAVRSN